MYVNLWRVWSIFELIYCKQLQSPTLVGGVLALDETIGHRVAELNEYVKKLQREISVAEDKLRVTGSGLVMSREALQRGEVLLALAHLERLSRMM